MEFSQKDLGKIVILELLKSIVNEENKEKRMKIYKVFEEACEKL